MSTRMTLASSRSRSTSWRPRAKGSSIAPCMKTRPLRLRVATGTPRALALADVGAAAGLARGVVQRAQELGDEVDDAEDLLLVPDVVARGEAVDARVEDLVADLLGDAEAAGRVLDVGDAVVDVVLLEDGGQGLLEDGAPGVAHDVPDQQDVHPDRLSAGARPVKRRAGASAGPHTPATRRRRCARVRGLLRRALPPSPTTGRSENEHDDHSAALRRGRPSRRRWRPRCRRSASRCGRVRLGPGKAEPSLREAGRGPAAAGAEARAVPRARRHREPRAAAARRQLPVPGALARRCRRASRWGTAG